MDGGCKNLDSSEKEAFNDADWVAENRYGDISEKKLVELVVCPIIPHILMDPICCTKCETHFCRKCISRAMEKDSRCPVCRQEMSVGAAQKIMNNLLDCLQVKCANFEQGCAVSVPYPSHKSHLEECGYESLACERFRCGRKFMRKDEEEHRVSCESEMIPCEFCLLEFTRSELKSHLANSICTEICQWCKIKVFRPSLANHEKVCDKIPILCLRCGGSFFRQSYEAHRDECRIRYDIGGKIRSNEFTVCSPLVSNQSLGGRANKNISNEVSPNRLGHCNSNYNNAGHGKSSFVNLVPGNLNLNSSRPNASQGSQNLLAPSNIVNMAQPISSPSQMRPASNQSTPVKMQVNNQNEATHSRKNLLPPQYQNYSQLISSPRKTGGAMVGFGNPMQTMGHPQMYMGNRR